VNVARAMLGIIINIVAVSFVSVMELELIHKYVINEREKYFKILYIKVVSCYRNLLLKLLRSRFFVISISILIRSSQSDPSQTM